STAQLFTLSLHDALPISLRAQRELQLQRVPVHEAEHARETPRFPARSRSARRTFRRDHGARAPSARAHVGAQMTAAPLVDSFGRSEEHTSELQSPYDLVC